MLATSEIFQITASAGRPTVFDFIDASTGSFRAHSASVTIQQVLIVAFLTRTKIEIELVNSGPDIRRVDPFEAAIQLPARIIGQNRISRIATQRNPSTGTDHLEDFMIKYPDTQEFAYNVFDPLLKSLVSAMALVQNDPGAAANGIVLDIEGNQNDLMSMIVRWI